MKHRTAVLKSRPAKPHLVYRDGRWQLFRSYWKSLFKDSARVSGLTIPELIGNLSRNFDRYRFGYRITKELP